MNEDVQVGPIDYLIVEFPDEGVTGEAFAELLKLVDSGTIRILDLLFVRKHLDGGVIPVTVSELADEGQLDLAAFEGAASGLIDADDLEAAGAAIEPGRAAGILIYENVWAAPFAAALIRRGAQLIASGRIPIPAMIVALDAAERESAPAS